MNVKTNSFATSDYVVFFATLAVAMGIGIYFAFKGRNKKTQDEYLMASHSMPVLPVAVSIIVSQLSAIALLGTPAEIYGQGFAYSIAMSGMVGGCLLAAVLFVPLFYPLQLTSVYEYLELRYNSRAVRLVGTCMMILSQVIYMGTASFAPSTALKTVTGIPVWATLILIGFASTFYTCVGGMKAVIWTDVFQSGSMLAGLLAVIIQGSIKVGGLTKVWEIAADWDRMDVFDFNPDPRVRHAFWPLYIGSTLAWMNMIGLQQPSVQRYASLPSIRKAQAATLITMMGSVFIIASCCLSGLVLFAYYVTKDCDPLGEKLVDNSNQLVPFFVMETLSYPCVPGIFMSALFSGALSSISSSLNSLAAITWEDILKPVVNVRTSESRKLLFIQAIVALYGCLALATSFIIQNLEGTVLQITTTLTGAAGGPLTGIFLLGAFFPWANAKGAIGGSVISFALCFWIAIGAYVTGIPKGKFPFPNGTCSEYLFNETSDSTTISIIPATMTTLPYTTSTEMGDCQDERSGVEQLYSLSYQWFAALGMTVTVVLGLIISFITGANSAHDVPTKYQIPLFTRLCCCLPSSWQKTLNCNRHFDKPQDILEQSDDYQKREKGTIPNPLRDVEMEIENPAFTHDQTDDNEKQDINGLPLSKKHEKETQPAPLTNGHTEGVEQDKDTTLSSSRL